MIQIWNLDTGNQLGEFRTVYDNCARLAIDAKGERILAASWRKGKNGGIACYEIASGHAIWHRADIGQVQHMHFSLREDRAWCHIDKRSAHCLDTATGSTLAKVRNAEEALDSPFPPQTFLFRHRDLVLEVEKRHITMPRLGFFCDCAFIQDALCVAEMAEQRDDPGKRVSFIRCFQTENGNERWRYICPDDYYIQLMSFQSDGFLYCVVAAGQEGRAESKTELLRLILESGSSTTVCPLESMVRPYLAASEWISW